MENKLYKNLKKLLGALIALIFRIEVSGAENEIADGPVLLCSNHMSNLDPILLGVALRRQVRFMAKSELFKIPLLRTLVSALGAYSVDRSKNDVSTVRTTLALLGEGEQVCIFPQGTRHSGVHPRDTKIKGGAGMFCTRTHAPVLPVHIMTKGYKCRPFRKTRIIIGQRIDPAELGIKADAGESAPGERAPGEYMRITGAIFERICRLSEE